MLHAKDAETLHNTNRTPLPTYQQLTPSFCSDNSPQAAGVGEASLAPHVMSPTTAVDGVPDAEPTQESGNTHMRVDRTVRPGAT